MKSYPVTKKSKAKAHMLTIAGEPTRMRMLCLLFENKQACVHEIAQACDVSIATASHHLQALKEAELVESERVGQTICYCLKLTEFSKYLKPIVCDNYRH